MTALLIYGPLAFVIACVWIAATVENRRVDKPDQDGV